MIGQGLYYDLMARRRKLHLGDFAELVGVKVNTLAAYLSRGEAGFPQPDGREVDGMYVRPWWWESTAKRWQASRPGSGNRTPRAASS